MTRRPLPLDDLDEDERQGVGVTSRPCGRCACCMAHRGHSRLPRLLNPEQAAGRLGRSASRVRQMIHEGTIIAANLAAAPKKDRPIWAIPESEIEAVLVARGIPVRVFDATDASIEVDASAIAHVASTEDE